MYVVLFSFFFLFFSHYFLLILGLKLLQILLRESGLLLNRLSMIIVFWIVQSIDVYQNLIVVAYPLPDLICQICLHHCLQFLIVV